MATSITRIAKILCCAIAIAVASPASATTYVVGPDEALLDEATHVAEVHVLKSVSPALPERAVTDHFVFVQRVLKGHIGKADIVVRLPGGYTEDGLELHIDGVPRFSAGDEALLFLVENEDGTFGVLHWALGAFRKHRVDGQALALRDLSDANILDGLLPTEERVRSYEAFRDWLRDRASGLRRDADYHRTPPNEAFESLFNLLQFSGRNIRWFEFDSGQEVQFRVRTANSFGTQGLLAPALEAWNRESRTPVQLRHVGSTSSVAGASRPDGVNSLIYGDPNRILPGRFSCSSGGIFAVGWPWLQGTGSFKGKTYTRIVEADIIINDGAECIKGLAQVMAEILTHEVGHTLGIAHSCGDSSSGSCTNASEADATMKAGGQFDGRSASIRNDDKAALRALYEGAGGGGGGGDGNSPPPQSPSANLIAPSNLVGVALSKKKIRLNWTDNSTGETSYEVWMKKGIQSWELREVLEPDAASTVIARLEPGKSYRFRVRSRAGDKVSKYSERTKVKTPRDGGNLNAPSDLRAFATTSTTGRLTWRDNSANEKSFVIWIRLGGGPWLYWSTLPRDTTTTTFIEATPGTTYTFKIRAKSGEKRSDFSNEASVTMPP